MNWAMISRSSFVMGVPYGSVRTTRTPRNVAPIRVGFNGEFGAVWVLRIPFVLLTYSLLPPVRRGGSFDGRFLLIAPDNVAAVERFAPSDRHSTLSIAAPSFWMETIF